MLLKSRNTCGKVAVVFRRHMSYQYRYFINLHSRSDMANYRLSLLTLKVDALMSDKDLAHE